MGPLAAPVRAGSRGPRGKYLAMSLTIFASPGRVMTLAALMALAGCGGSQPQQAPPPPAVTVATPVVSEIVDWDDYVGRFEAIEDVEVKPRVSGYLQSS